MNHVMILIGASEGWGRGGGGGVFDCFGWKTETMKIQVRSF